MIVEVRIFEQGGGFLMIELCVFCSVLGYVDVLVFVFGFEIDLCDIICWVLVVYFDLLMLSVFNFNGVVLFDFVVQVGYWGEVVFVDIGYYFFEMLVICDWLESCYFELIFVILNVGVLLDDGQMFFDFYVSDFDVCCVVCKVDFLQCYLKE